MSGPTAIPPIDVSIAKANFRLVGAAWEPTDAAWARATPATKAAYRRRLGELAVAAKRLELRRGLGVDGVKLTPRKHPRADGADGPVLSPHRAQSRFQRLLAFAVNSVGVTLYWRSGWAVVVGAHAFPRSNAWGQPKRPKRDTVGLTTASRRRVLQQARLWWRNRNPRRRPPPPPAPAPQPQPIPKPIPTPKPAPPRARRVIYLPEGAPRPRPGKHIVVVGGRPDAPPSPAPTPKPSPVVAPPPPPPPPQPPPTPPRPGHRAEGVQQTLAARHPGTTVDFQGLHPEVAEAIARQFDRLAVDFPGVARGITYLGTLRNLEPGVHHPTLNRHYFADSPLAAGATSFAGGVLALNPAYLKHPEVARRTLGESAASGHTTPDAGTPEGLLSHEFGHRIEGHLKLDRPADHLAARTLLAATDARELSRYAQVDGREYFAEAVASYLHTPRHRQPAGVADFGDFLRAILGPEPANGPR